MDEIALRYLLLGLRLARHVPALVRSYHGPGELAEAVGGELLTPAAELHDEAMQLAGLAAELPVETAAQRRRGSWLIAQVGAMGALARQAGGEEIGYVDLVEELYDIEVQLEPDSTFEAARRMLDAALPGDAPLRERLAAHDLETGVAPDEVVSILSRLSDGFEKRTRAQVWLPQNASITFEEAHAVPWVSLLRYEGGGRSVVLVNVDRPLTIGSVMDLAASEGYPGRHAEASVKDDLLVAVGHAELALIANLSPQALVSAGMAGLGREVVMSDQELWFELRRLAQSVDRRLDPAAELAIQRARVLLRPALGNAAVALHRDGEPVALVRSYLAEVALLPDEILDETVSRLADAALRTEPFTQIEGRRLVSEWLEVHGQTHGYARLLAEQQTPGTLRSEMERTRVGS
jgi:hypothetical protein